MYKSYEVRGEHFARLVLSLTWFKCLIGGLFREFAGLILFLLPLLLCTWTRGFGDGVKVRLFLFQKAFRSPFISLWRSQAFYLVLRFNLSFLLLSFTKQSSYKKKNGGF